MSDERFEYGSNLTDNHTENTTESEHASACDRSAVSSERAGYNYSNSAASSGSAGYNYGNSAASSGSAGYNYGNSAASSGSAGYNYSNSAAPSGSAGYNYGNSSASSGNAGYGYGSSAASSNNGEYAYSNSDASSEKAQYAYGDSDAASEDTGHNYSGQGDSGRDSAGTGRYYSYSRSHGGGSTPGTPPRKDGGKGRGRIAVALALVLVFIIGAGGGALISSRSRAGTASGDSSSARSRIESSENEADKKENNSGSGTEKSGEKIATVEEAMSESSLSDTTVADVAEKVMPAIVSVYNKFTEESEFFGRTYTQEGESAGSGIIIEQTDSELLIVTNNHVVAGADSLSVQFIDEENCEASLKGTDASSDLAVISVSMDALSEQTRNSIAIADLGDSDSLRIGEHAIAIGNALGYGQSLTVGYISALNREITSEDGITGTFIQTDAAINPGNSGGALLNSRGQVIGINSNKIGGDAIEGMGFAIPISKAIPIIDSLKTQESRTKVAEEDQGVLGIYGISVTSDVASAYNLPVGAYIEEIIEGTGAADSDLQQGDIITAINGQTITGMEDLQNQLVYFSAGEEVTLTVQHPVEGGEYEEREIKVTLSKRSTVSSSGERESQQTPGLQEMPGEEQDESGVFSFPFGF